MQLELMLTNEPRVLSSVRAFARETLGQLALQPPAAEGLETLIVGAIDDAIQHAYPAGDEGSITLSITEKHGRLEVLVRDFGVPQDVAVLERKLHETPAGSNLFGCLTADTVDELHWLAYGPKGKALQVVKWLHEQNVADEAEAQGLAPFHDDVPLAPPQEYDVGRLRAEEAIQVSQLMYRAYGGTYFNADVYYPERVAAQNAKGSLISMVARTSDGRIAGHCALELNQAGPVAELGQAVVDPAHRGRGLLDRLKAELIVEAERRQLAGWYGDAVAVHTFTQKSNATHGGHLTCANLAISPKTEAFRGISAVQPQRVTCLLYFHWLKDPEPRVVHVPERQRTWVASIYQNLGCPMEFAAGGEASGHGTLSIKVESGAGRGTVRVEQVGCDTVHCIRHARRDLIEQSGAEVVYVELPLDDPATPIVAEELEKYGFAFVGITPHFAARSDLMRLAYLVGTLEREPIKTYEPFGDELVNYVLAEQQRVLDAL